MAYGWHALYDEYEGDSEVVSFMTSCHKNISRLPQVGGGLVYWIGCVAFRRDGRVVGM